MSLSLERKIHVAFAVTLALLTTVGALSLRSIIRQVEVTSDVAHTREALQKLYELMDGLSEAEAAQRGYVIAGDERFLES